MFGAAASSSNKLKPRYINKDAFIVKWIIDTPGFNLVLPLSTIGGEVYDFTIDWGDGSPVQRITTSTATHVYQKTGTYYTKMVGRFDGFYIYHSPSVSAKVYIPDGTTKDKIDSVIQWGTNKFYHIRFPGSSLKEVPNWGAAPDFSGVTNMFGLFALCKLRTNPIKNLFEKAYNVLDFHAPYSRCDITAIPRGLMDNIVKATDIGSVVAHNKIKKVPKDLFKYCQAATITTNLFRNNLIEELPQGIFDGLINSTRMAFVAGENKFTSLPPGLFAKNTKVWEWEEAFVLSPVETIPADLFGDNTANMNLKHIFRGCPIKSIPPTLFDRVSNVVSFNNAFDGCPIDGPVPKVWERFPGATGTKCFTNLTKITNANEIPASYK
jgi:hypothetical protein